MTSPSAHRARSEAGFVLIGVIIFVLALTIIGISLFSLSSYEAQFLQRSQDDEQAFQSAMGGIERAKYLLCATSRLDRIGTSLPRSGDVVSAWCTQYLTSTDTVTTNDMVWDTTTTVVLRVTARVGDAQRTVVAGFRPEQVTNYYRQLITVGDGIVVDNTIAGRNQSHTVTLTGAIWNSQEHPNPWEQQLRHPRPTPVLTSPVVPVPAATDFIAGRSGALHASFYRSDPVHRPGRLDCTLDCGSDEIRTWNTDGSDPDWSLYVGYMIEAGTKSDPMADDSHISVRGFAVWTFPRGVEFMHTVEVSRLSPFGPSKDCLVIVAGDQGIHFLGGLSSTIPVILVSSGQVAIRHENDYTLATGYSVIDDLSIFARSVNLLGPEYESSGGGGPGWWYAPTYYMRLRHPANGLLNTQYVPYLMANSALPNAGSSTGHKLALRAGTWRTSAP